MQPIKFTPYDFLLNSPNHKYGNQISKIHKFFAILENGEKELNFKFKKLTVNFLKSHYVVTVEYNMVGKISINMIYRLDQSYEEVETSLNYLVNHLNNTMIYLSKQNFDSR